MTRKKRSSLFTSPASWFLFSSFVLISLAVVTLLEYRDYQKGKKTFIFSTLLRLDAEKSRLQFNDYLIGLLRKNSIPFDYFRDSQGVFHFKIDAPADSDRALITAIRTHINRLKGEWLLSQSQRSARQIITLYEIHLRGRLTHILLLSEPVRLAGATEVEEKAVSKKTPAVAKPKAPPRIALIIDDIGYQDGISLDLKDLQIPLTAAIIPDSPYAAAEAERLHSFGIETLIHLPMQSNNFSNHDPATAFVKIDSSEADIEQMVRSAQAIVPWARGINNHMGSRITSDPEAIERVLRVLNRLDLFFVDSKTSADSQGYQLAKKFKVRTARRDVFIDDQQDYAYSRQQIRKLAALAERDGKALAIGHPFPSTLAALKDELSEIRSRGIRLVPVSQLLE